MNAINGSSDITPLRAEEMLKKQETLNEYYVKDTETRNTTIPASDVPDVEAIRNATPDVEYDEFKQSDDNVIEMKRAEAEKPMIAPPNGQIRIVDMTKEQLQNAVVNLMNVQQQLEATLKEYQARAKRIQAIWSDKKSVKERYFMLRDNPKAKGVKVT